MIKIIIKNQLETLVNESGLEYITSKKLHTNEAGEVLVNIGSDETMCNAIHFETCMEQDGVERVINLLSNLLDSQGIYNIQDEGGYFVKPEIAKMLKEHLGIDTFKGMTNDESAAMWDFEVDIA